MSPRRAPSSDQRNVRRFWARAQRLAREHHVSLQLAARMVREDERRAKRLVREIRRDARLVARWCFWRGERERKAVRS